MKTRLALAMSAMVFLGTIGIANANDKGKWKAKREARLAKLKEKNPEKYAEVMKKIEARKAKHKAFKAEMKKLKETDPEAFKAKRKARHEAHLAKLKEKNPEKYAEVMKKIEARKTKIEARKAKHKAFKAEMKKLKETDPEAFKAKLKEMRAKRDACLAKLKEKNPEKYAKVMKKIEARKARKGSKKDKE